MSSATVIRNNETHHFVFNLTTSTVPGILADIGLEIDNEFFLISLTTTLSVILFIQFLITDAYKLLRQVVATAKDIKPLLDQLYYLNYRTSTTCPTDIAFSGLKAHVDLAFINKFRNLVLNLEWDNSCVMDLPTDLELSMPMPTFLLLGYYQTRTIFSGKFWRGNTSWVSSFDICLTSFSFPDTQLSDLIPFHTEMHFTPGYPCIPGRPISLPQKLTGNLINYWNIDSIDFFSTSVPLYVIFNICINSFIFASESKQVK